MGSFGSILHYDGSTWSEMATPTNQHLRSIWGSPDFGVLAVGFFGTILHYDGESWRGMDGGSTQALWEVGGFGNIVFAVGDAGTILRYGP